MRDFKLKSFKCKTATKYLITINKAPIEDKSLKYNKKGLKYLLILYYQNIHKKK